MTACFEDVGRHNALDKLIGHCLLGGIKMDDKVLLLSGRASYEMLSKALRCGISFVVSISAPSSLAVEIAKRGNIALAGILRGSTMKIYSRFDDFI
jgi:FdhD protein